MNALKYCIILAMTMCASMASAQSHIEAMFDKARELNDRKEFSQAAEQFKLLQVKAYMAGDLKNYILALTARGECYYMLDFATGIKETLDMARRAFSANSSSFDEATRLWLAESISKLEGSYFYTILDSDETAADKAEKAYLNSLVLLDSIKELPDSYFDDTEAETIIRRELLSLYYKQGLYAKALEQSDAVYYYWTDMGYNSHDKSARGMRDYYSFVDAVVSRAMILARLQSFDEANEVLSLLPDECNDEPSVLRTKGKILVLQHAAGGADNRGKAKEYYARYLKIMKLQVQQQLAQLGDESQEQYWLAVHDFLHDCYSLGDYAPAMLYDEALFGKGFLLEYRKNRNARQSRWFEVKNVLGRKECAIEFVQYNNKDNEKQLAALVIKKGFKAPVFVDIAPVREITSTILQNGLTVGDALASDNGAAKDALYSNEAVSRMVWTKELQELINGCDKVYFAPEGLLHQYAIEYVYPNEEIEFHRLSSTRVLLNSKELQVNAGSILFIGGIDYNTPVSPAKEDNDILGYYNLKRTPVYINNLAGTAAEVEAIYSLRNSQACKGDTILGGVNATDEAFSTLAAGYSFIHLATHGYFSGNNDYSDMKPLYRDHAMSESGIMMAGAGSNLNSWNFNPALSDGIITAEELSAIDLSAVDMVVLSACQTGLGYITADGVYGVQRAIKIAGVKAMAVSLWSVDDAATAEFMRLFYSELEKGTSKAPDVHKAFNTARRALAKDGKSSARRFAPGTLSTKEVVKHFNKPQYSNAFILIDVL